MVALGAVVAGSVHLVSQPERTGNQSVNFASAPSSAAPSNSAPAKKPSASGLKLTDGQVVTLTEDIVPQQDNSTPVVDFGGATGSDALLLLADRLAQQEGYPMRDGYHLHTMRVSHAAKGDGTKILSQNWLTADGRAFYGERVDQKTTKATPDKIFTAGSKAKLVSFKPYRVAGYQAANGDGALVVEHFKKEHDASRNDLGRLMFKEFSTDIAGPLTGLQKAGMLRGLATVEGVAVSKVTKDYFGRDVVTVTSKATNKGSGLLLSARTGEPLGTVWGSGQEQDREYVFHGFVKAAK